MAKHALPLNRTRADAERHITAHSAARARFMLYGRETRREQPAHAVERRAASFLPPVRTWEELNPFRSDAVARRNAAIDAVRKSLR